MGKSKKSKDLKARDFRRRLMGKVGELKITAKMILIINMLLQKQPEYAFISMNPRVKDYFFNVTAEEWKELQATFRRLAGWTEEEVMEVAKLYELQDLITKEQAETKAREAHKEVTGLPALRMHNNPPPLVMPGMQHTETPLCPHFMMRASCATCNPILMCGGGD